MLNIPKLRRTMPQQVQVDFQRVTPNFLTDRHCGSQMNNNNLLTLMTASSELLKQFVQRILQRRHYFIEVAYNAVVSNFKDRCFRVLVDSHNNL